MRRPARIVAASVALVAALALAATMQMSPTSLAASSSDECTGPSRTPPAPAGFTGHTATVARVQLHYAAGGHGKRVVVLLHGWPEDWYAWSKIMPDPCRPLHGCGR